MIEKKGYANIALIKYWGKENDKEITPSTSSLSVCLKDFYTITKLSKSVEDEIYINDILQVGSKKEKLIKYIDLIRKEDKFKIESYNNFPTAAGLSSSSSGISALTKAIFTYYNKYLIEDMMKISKYGSGSSCRSYTNNYTVWDTSNKIYSFRSKMKLSFFAIIVEDAEKKISSREAMKISKETSTLFKRWIMQSKIDFKKAKYYLKINDFKKLGNVVKRNFKLMHNTLKYSSAKYTYLTKESQEIINKLDKLQIKYDIFYTMDAGSNVKVFCKQNEAEKIYKLLNKIFRYNIMKSEIMYD